MKQTKIKEEGKWEFASVNCLRVINFGFVEWYIIYDEFVYE